MMRMTASMRSWVWRLACDCACLAVGAWVTTPSRTIAKSGSAETRAVPLTPRLGIGGCCWANAATVKRLIAAKKDRIFVIDKSPRFGQMEGVGGFGEVGGRAA